MIECSNTECQGDGVDVTFPGTDHIGSLGGYTGKVGSFLCGFRFDPPK